MAHNVIMPQMGESVAEGTIVRWLKAVGESVDRDEPIFEITTDKVDAEIPAPEGGVLLEIKVDAGETVEVGTLVAVIGEAGESAPAPSAASSADAAPAPQEAAVEPAAGPAPAVAQSAAGQSAADLRRTKSTPVVRKIAQEHGIDIAQISGSGLDGRVTKKDILAFIDAGGASAAPAAVSSAPVAAASSGSGIQVGIPMSPVSLYGNDRIEPMSKMRRVISDRMIESKAYSAHVHTCFEIDYTRVDGLRRKYKSSYADRGGRLTFTTFLAKAVVNALGRHPIVNAAHDGENVIYRGDINLGIAVALDWGLIVPVIKSADDYSMLALSKHIADKGERARTKKLAPDEVSGLTFSITNPGVFGSQWGTPIIPQPSVAILGVGTIEKRPKVVTLADGTDTIAIKTCGYVTLGFDHRVIDGAVADQFVSDIKHTLENFDESAM
ncbi:MAG: dihydrolipoamide acetyltransferase family protein [Myxococcota bacterium]|nr:dihydrolipoamide acetyltransferase family protein [Myxococcota bacterium]